MKAGTFNHQFRITMKLKEVKKNKIIVFFFKFSEFILDQLLTCRQLKSKQKGNEKSPIVLNTL